MIIVLQNSGNLSPSSCLSQSMERRNILWLKTRWFFSINIFMEERSSKAKRDTKSFYPEFVVLGFAAFHDWIWPISVQFVLAIISR